MALSDREKLEIAEVVDAVLEPRLRELSTDIAKGFVVILECCMEDLAKVLENENGRFVEKMRASREQREREMNDAATHVKGFAR